jgi:hypothetical protein
MNKAGRTGTEKKKRMQGCGGKPEEERPLRKPRRRWDNNNKMDFQEMG